VLPTLVVPLSMIPVAGDAGRTEPPPFVRCIFLKRRTELTDEIHAEHEGFAALGISGQFLKAIATAGYATPKPIQIKAIPPFLAGRDVLAIAQTGSGKTAAFALPILAKIAALGSKRRPRTARALVLVPTRELAVQIEESIRLLSRGAHIS